MGETLQGSLGNLLEEIKVWLKMTSSRFDLRLNLPSLKRRFFLFLVSLFLSTVLLVFMIAPVRAWGSTVTPGIYGSEGMIGGWGMWVKRGEGKMVNKEMSFPFSSCLKVIALLPRNYDQLSFYPSFVVGGSLQPRCLAKKIISILQTTEGFLTTTLMS